VWSPQTFDDKDTVTMAETNTLARTLHDVGLAAWFGGTLMGAVGINGASEEVSDPKDRVRVANAGWGRWTPINLAAIAAHLLGGAQLVNANRHRLAGQSGVPTYTTVKTGATAAALAATAYSRVLGQKVMEAEADAARQSFDTGNLEAEGATTPAPSTPDDVAKAQRQLKLLQWIIPALTGLIVVLNARMGEQQRPAEVAHGLLDRVNPFN